MALPIPHSMYDTEPMVLRLGPPLRLVPTQRTAPVTRVSNADYDPWFTVQREVEEKLAKKRIVPKKKGAARSLCPLDLAARGHVQNWAKQLYAGAHIWVWCECSSFNPDTCIMLNGKPHFPYAGYIVEKDIFKKTCRVRLEIGVTSPAVPFDMIRVSNPLETS